MTAFTLAAMATVESKAMKVVEASEIISKVEKGEPIDYSDVTVEGDLNLSRIGSEHIISSINITDSIINGSIDLENAILNELINFRRTEFMGSASFIGTRFNRDVYFDGVRFNGRSLFMDSRFNGSAHFSYVVFNESTNFLGARFETALDFHNSKFDKTALFKSVGFGDETDFEETKFESSAIFKEAKFGNAEFAGTLFRGLVDFGSAQFAESADFTGAKFGKKLYFSNVKFKKLFIIWESFRDELVCDGPTYLLLIKNFKDMEQFEDADDCYYQYREVKRQERPFDWGKLFDYLSWLSCGYGVRWQHPILSGSMIAILFGMYFESYCLRRKAANFLRKQELKNPCKYDFMQNFKKSMSYSVMLLLSLPPEWSQFGRDEFAKFVTRHWFSSILERLIGWGLVLLLIGTLTRLMVRY